MRSPRTTLLCALAVFVLVVAPPDVQAQTAQTEPSSVDESTTVDTGFDDIEEIIVRGRSFGELRFEIRRSEEAVFARFNELNSTDDFDIRCRFEKYGHMRGRSCKPNFVRELEGKAAEETVRAMRGQASPGLVQLYAADGRRLRQLMDAEMRQLVEQDPQLQDAVAEFSQAQLALTLARGKQTLVRQVTAASGSLPYDAERMFEVIIGVKPFRHALTQPTFTIADVLGEIRDLTVECAEGRQQLDYEGGIDWTLPTGWSACTLQVKAERQTTFRLYEF